MTVKYKNDSVEWQKVAEPEKFFTNSHRYCTGGSGHEGFYDSQ